MGDVDYRDALDRTPLHLAAASGHPSFFLGGGCGQAGRILEGPSSFLLTPIFGDSSIPEKFPQRSTRVSLNWPRFLSFVQDV